MKANDIQSIRQRMADARIDASYTVNLARDYSSQIASFTDIEARRLVDNARASLAKQVGEALVAKAKLKVEPPNADEVSLGQRTVNMVVYALSEKDAAMVSLILKALKNGKGEDAISDVPMLASDFDVNQTLDVEARLQSLTTESIAVVNAAMADASRIEGRGVRRFRDILLSGGDEDE